MQFIVSEDPEPIPQTGEVEAFTRRTPAESEIEKDLTPEELYDFIRMLDSEKVYNSLAFRLQ